MPLLRAASPYVLAALLGGAGVLHLVDPTPFESIVPAFLPARLLVAASGIAELSCAIALVPVHSRRAGALATAALFVLVFPANIQMAVDAHGVAGRVVAYARLPLQIPLVLWALQVYRSRSRLLRT